MTAIIVGKAIALLKIAFWPLSSPAKAATSSDSEAVHGRIRASSSSLLSLSSVRAEGPPPARDEGGAAMCAGRPGDLPLTL